MKLPQRSGPRGLSNNMTPMIDVVFLLIIFFLVSSHLARQEARVPLPLPTAATHQIPDETAQALTVHVMEDGTWRIAGTNVDQTGLADALQEYRSRNGATALVRVRVARQVRYDRMEPILRAAAIAGLPNVSLAVYRPSNALGRG